MATFPVLKSGAVAQYPADRSVRYATEVLEFVDGSEQRFGLFGAPLHRWAIRLDLLDERELFELEAFFVAQTGAAGSFVFTDPLDGVEYADCSFESDDLALVFAGQGNGQTEVVVRENR
jgi:hypothetical protein